MRHQEPTKRQGGASLMLLAFLLEEYGPRLSVDQLAKVLCITSKALHNQRSAGTFGIPMYIDGGKLWADYRDVAAYFDDVRKSAKEAATVARRTRSQSE